MVLPFVIVEFWPEQNINTIRDITLKPLSVYPRVFGVHLSFLLILVNPQRGGVQEIQTPYTPQKITSIIDFFRNKYNDLHTHPYPDPQTA